MSNLSETTGSDITREFVVFLLGVIAVLLSATGLDFVTSVSGAATAIPSAPR